MIKLKGKCIELVISKCIIAFVRFNQLLLRGYVLLAVLLKGCSTKKGNCYFLEEGDFVERLGTVEAEIIKRLIGETEN